MQFKPNLKPFKKFEKAETGNQTIRFGQKFPKLETGNSVSVWFKPSLNRFQTKLPQHYHKEANLKNAQQFQSKTWMGDSGLKWTAWINDKKMLKDSPYLNYFHNFLSYFFHTESYLAFGLSCWILTNYQTLHQPLFNA